MFTVSSNKNIIAISGSAGSSNHAILRYLISIIHGDVDYIIYDGLAQPPHFDPGLDGEDPPVPVKELRQLLAEASGVIVCSPECAFGVQGSLKNALDWTVGSGSLECKPASTGGEHAHAALMLILKNALGANLSEDANLLIPLMRTKMDKNGILLI